VVICQLHDDPSFGVAVEGGEKQGKVAHVVDDVVTHDHVRLGSIGGDVRPAADDLCVPHPAPLGPVCEHVEHGLALVDGDQDTGRWCQREAGGPAACAHIEYRPSRGDRLRGASPRRGGRRVGQRELGRPGEQARRKSPRGLWRCRQHGLGDGPRGQLARPAGRGVSGCPG
jgi:hypothetical protein